MLLNTSLYTKNQASTPKTFAKIIFFISPYLGQYNKKREVFKGGGEIEGEFWGWHLKI